jgi:hypothetical protein
VCKSACFSFRTFDLGEDLVRVLGPGERAGVVVPAVDERADRCGELLDGGEGAETRSARPRPAARSGPVPPRGPRSPSTGPAAQAPPGQNRAPSRCARDSGYAIVPRSRGNITQDTRQNTRMPNESGCDITRIFRHLPGSPPTGVLGEDRLTSLNKVRAAFAPSRPYPDSRCLHPHVSYALPSEARLASRRSARWCRLLPAAHRSCGLVTAASVRSKPRQSVQLAVLAAARSRP